MGGYELAMKNYDRKQTTKIIIALQPKIPMKGLNNESKKNL